MSAVLKRAICLSVCLLIGSLSCAYASPSDTRAPSTVRIGVYDFPPIAVVNEQNQAEGLLGDVLDELEAAHKNLSFRVVHTSPRRRQLDFKSGLFDVMFFEHPNWSWNSDTIEVSAPILRDEEVYVALKKDGRDQSFFDDIRQRRIVAIAGYHYGFARLETDSKQLQKHFNIELSHSHDRNLDLIEADRPSVAEVAVVSRSFLHTYFSEFPEKKDLFLISDRPDQSYELHIVGRRNGDVSAEQVENLLQPLIDSGRYQEMVRQHGLKLPHGMVRSP